MRDRKGWKALGYESFDAYGRDELGYEKSHLYRLAETAEIERSIGFSPIGEKAKESQLRPLAPLSDEERRKVWEEATARAEEEIYFSIQLDTKQRSPRRLARLAGRELPERRANASQPLHAGRD